jgi:deoxyribodipyrimidine photo-lyase
MEVLRKDFADSTDLTNYVRSLCPWAHGTRSSIKGGRTVSELTLVKFEPNTYVATRNFGDGNVSKLSPYISHGVISINEVRDYIINSNGDISRISKFIEELGWRDFWQRVSILHPNWLWQNIEPYKTGFNEEDYQESLSGDILSGKTGVACIDAFIASLVNEGYLHNHARMYLASYIVHFRRIKWQAGARWFLSHLLDGDIASNNFSWQWIASTFSNKPYIFNLENVDKYFGRLVDTTPENNKILNYSYEQLSLNLFSLIPKSYP